MDIQKNLTPFDTILSFELLVEQYKKQLQAETNPIIKSQIQTIVDYIDTYPELISGVKSDNISKYEEAIEVLLSGLIPEALSAITLKAFLLPFEHYYFYYSKRLQALVEDISDFNLKITNLSDDELYILGCSYILQKQYHINTSFYRPYHYTIPNKNGVNQTYRADIKADYIEVNPTERSKPITEKDIDKLLQNFDDIALWKTLFPPQSWELKGFTIIELTNVSHDKVIADLKADMLAHSLTHDQSDSFLNDFKRLFGVDDLQMGTTFYDNESQSFVNQKHRPLKSFALGDLDRLRIDEMNCDDDKDSPLTNKMTYVVITDIDNHKDIETNIMLKNLQKQGFKSCIIFPIVIKNELRGVFELVSSRKNSLNTLNVNLLNDIMPFVEMTAERSINEMDNYVKAVIQNECTSIHQTVQWKFVEEAQRLIEETVFNNNPDASFNDVVFEDVHPLYGQIDIVGSSTIRNTAIKSDFTQQLEAVKTIFEAALKEEKLPLYEEVILNTSNFLNELQTSLNTTSEERLIEFLTTEINPIMSHIKKISKALDKRVTDYEKSIDKHTGVIYQKRKDYENAVQYVNVQIAKLLEKKQEEAQQIFPHFFEHYKTDGVEHNMYIGQSLVKNKIFEDVYLKNLRLWQLTTMCDMERAFYKAQEKNPIPIQLHAASLLLVYGNTLSIRYRVDEKHFDVDGAYNARYEIVKKRIDKANIKGTNERLTVKHKIVVIYAQQKDKYEYLNYIEYLQNKNYLKPDIEFLDVEDLKGVIGLKALRVAVNYDA